VWDLWWIGTASARQGRGIGGELLGFVEAAAREAGGRLLLIETSSQPALDSTRLFYAKRGYIECGRVPDFYGEGDAKVIYAKRLKDAEPLRDP
jgi:ribosomal protein S18 acetylase RimI-like enzyme